MRILIVEDDVSSRFLLTEFLGAHGACHVAVDGEEAVEAVRRALDANEPYDMICLDIMMPRMDGQAALAQIRSMESEKGILLGEGAKVLMTTTLSDSKNIMNAFKEQCDAYIVKPVTEDKLNEQMKKLGLLS